MNSDEIAVIVEKAKELRNEEMRKIDGLLAVRSRLYIRLLRITVAALLHHLSAALRPLFSWNPQHHHS